MDQPKAAPVAANAVSSGTVARDHGTVAGTVPARATRAARLAPAVAGAIVLATVVVAVLGAIGIAAKSLSLDEVATLRYASLPGRRLIDLIVRDQANMSPYYVGMWPWVRLADTELWLRLPSLIATVASVPVLFLVGRRLVGEVAAALAVLLFATSAMVVEFAQTARSYSIATLMVLLATWAYLDARERPTRPRLALYVLAVAAATYLHFVCGLIVIAHLVHLVRSGGLHRDRHDRRAWLAVGVGLALTCGPLVVLLALQDDGQVSWIPPLSVEHVAGSVGAWLGGTLAAAVVTVCGLVAGVVVAIRSGRAEALLIVAWALLPLAALVIVSVVKPFLVSRYLLFTLPAVALLVGLALARLPRNSRIALLALAVAVSASGVAAWYARPVPEWRALAEFLDRLRGPRDIVLYDVPYSQPAVEYYMRRIEAEPLPAVDYDQLALHPQRRLWVVVHGRSPAERQAMEAQLRGTWDLFRSYGFEGVSLRRYVPVGDGDG